MKRKWSKPSLVERPVTDTRSGAGDVSDGLDQFQS